MLKVVRRGPTSIPRLLLSSSSNTRGRIPFSSRPTLYHLTQPLASSVIARGLHSTPRWNRYATAEAEAEEELVDGQIADEVYSQRPPSDSQIDQQIQQGPVTKFQELADRNMVCKTLVNTITQHMKLETMTQVQSLTINETLKGIDVLAQARTGTGKTLAFLIPVLQNIINYDPSLEHRSRSGQVRSSPTDIRAIIISPTRELAEQIAVEARKLVRNTGVIVQTAVGGSAKAFGLRKIKNEGCHVLIGTPGRLNDILSDPYSSVRAPNLSAFVLDEADRLLDQGFAPEIEAIQDLLPKRRDIDRQTLLFSATVPQEVMEIVRRTMKPDFQFVRTVQEGEQQTHEKVPQMVVNVRGFENHMPSLLELCKRELARKDTQPFKAIVYFGATAEVTLAATIFRNLKNPGASLFHQHPLHPAQIIEMHARLSQQQRTKAADSFRRAQCGIMFSSDVTARGMDFPNVTHVIQIGIPSSRDNYIHRVGRTARGDKKGEGWLFLTALEARDARSRLSHLPMQPDESLQTASVDMTKDAQVPEYIANILTQVVDATKMVEASIKGAAYLASLGVYQWMAKKQMLVDALNNRAKYAWGSEKPPAVNPRLVQKLGLSRVEGLNIGEREYSIEGRESSSGYGGQRSRSSTGGRGDWREGRGGDRGSSGGDREGGFGRPPRNFDRSERPFPRHDRTDRMVGSYGREGRGPGVNRDSYGEQRRTRAY